jgi:hypothetical protein
VKGGEPVPKKEKENRKDLKKSGMDKEKDH